MSKRYGKYVSVCTIKDHTFFKAQRVNSREDQARGLGYWRYQKHFKTLEDAQAYVAAREGK